MIIIGEKINGTTPLCIDSPNVETIKKVFPYVQRQGIINSVSGEGEKPCMKEWIPQLSIRVTGKCIHPCWQQRLCWAGIGYAATFRENRG